ncbi:50S ribosomal protein L2 [Candidatus Woesearchaeota archaeon]|nr:50S ribosomal protein L2 [Candidatus Woesearchaeota archaeon]
MGKRLIIQRRGRGTMTYRSPSFKFRGQIKHRMYDDVEKSGVVYGRVVDLVHCSGHSAPLAEIEYENKERTLIAAPETIKVNDSVASGSTAPAQKGNTLPLSNIPEGTLIFNIESMPGDGGKFARTAGTFGKILVKGEKVSVILPSKKIRLFDGECRATIGVVAGGGMKEKPFMKAGKRMHAMRAKNKLYPKTSGVAMNAVDHPFGCGRGRHPGKPKIAPRFAPSGRNVGLIHPRKTGRGR